MSYLDFIEEYLEPQKINQFEKINILAQRAKDLYAGKSCLADGMSARKPTAQAQTEFKAGLLEPVITEIIEEEVPKDEDAE